MALIAHYKLDGNANDVMGQFHGTDLDVNWVDGKLGKCADFNGSSSYIHDKRVSDYLHGRPEASIALWVKKDLVQYGFLQLSGFANSNGNLYPYNTPYNAYLDVFRTDRLGPIQMPKSTLEWHHLIITQAPGIWQLFQDGVLVHTATANQTVSTNYLQFELGRNSSSRYADGKFDDVRIYDHALSRREIRDLSLGLNSRYKLNGDDLDSMGGAPISLSPKKFLKSDKGVVADVSGGMATIPLNNSLKTLSGQSVSFWAQSDILRSSVGGGSFDQTFVQWGTYYDSNSGGLGIYSGSITAYLKGSTGSGWSANSSFPIGNSIYDAGGMILYTVVFESPTLVSFYMNATKIGQVSLSSPYTELSTVGFTFGANIQAKLSDIRQYATALTQEQITEIYQNRASLDARGSFYTTMFRDTGIRQKLNLNYTTWQAGQTGAVGMFNVNGSASENYRVIDSDPWGKPTVVWEARPDSASGPDGGWSASQIAIDKTKTHRFSTWIRRTVIGNGSYYLGCTATPAVLNRTNGAANSNPYFTSGAWSRPAEEWILVVGHVWPSGSGTGAVHEDSGIYSVHGDRIGDTSDFVFADNANTIGHRSYLYYSTDTSTRQQWCYPRMDVCDGTEPSITDLLNGFDSRNEDLFRKHNGEIPGQSVSTLVSGSFSEVGVTNGLVAYYPLIKDAKDHSGGNKHGTVNGATATGDGYYFDGTSTISAATALDRDVPQEWTTSALVFMDSNEGSAFFNNFNNGNKLVHAPTNKRSLLYLNSGVDDSYVYGPTIPLDNWVHVVYRHDQINLDCSIFVDNIHYGPSANYESTDIPSGIPATTVFGSGFVGRMKEVKIFNRALTSEEVAIEYKRLGSTKMTQHQGVTYIQGELKEI